MKYCLFVLAAALVVSCVTAPPTPKTAAKPAVPTAPQAPRSIALPIVVVSYYANGDLSGTVKTTYDGQGRLVRQETSNGNGVLTEVKTGQAHGAQWRITSTSGQSGAVTSIEDLTLDAQGRVLVQSFLSPQGVIQASNEYTYDGQGRKLQWLAKTGDGGLQARTVYSFDASGNNVRTEVYDSGGTLTNVFESTFGAPGEVATRTGYDASHNVVEVTNFTWLNGKKVKEETVKPMLRTIEYRYDDKSAPTEIVSSVRGKVVERQTLQYQWITIPSTGTP